MSDLITEGRHRAFVRVSDTGLQFGEVGESADRKEQVAVLFDIVGDGDPDSGRSITWFGFFTEKTFDRTIESLRYCGWEGEDLAELPGLAAEGKLCQEVELVIKHEEYEGKFQARVNWVNRPGGGAIKLKSPLDGAALSDFGARMRGRVRAAGMDSNRRQSRPANPMPARGRDLHPNAPGGAVDDDIPF